MRSQNTLQRQLILLSIALILAVFLATDNAFAHVSVSCRAGPSTWKWTVHLRAGDILEKGDVFTVVFGVPVTKKNLITPSKWKVSSVKENRVKWQYTGKTINVRYNGPVAEFGYKDAKVVNGTVPWGASFPTNMSGNTCGPVSLTSPRSASLVAPSAQTGAVTAFVAAEGGSLASADGTVTISFPAGVVSQADEIIYMPQVETEVNNFTVIRAFTLDTYEEDSQQQASNFNQPVAVQTIYTDVELKNVNEEELKLYYFDSPSNEWVPVQSSVDVAANTVVAELSASDSLNKLYALMAPALPEAPAPLEASVPPTEVSEPLMPGSSNLISLVGVALIVLIGWFGLRKRHQGKASSNKN